MSEYMKNFWAMIDRLGLTPDPELDAEADRIAAKMNEGRKFVPLDNISPSGEA